MENSIKGSRIGYNLRQGGGCTRAVLARLSPSLHSCIGLLQNLVFVISRNFNEIFNFVFCKIFLKFCKNLNYFVKLEKNFMKHEIQNFAKLRKLKFCSISTPTQSAVRYSPSPSVCQKILQCRAAMQCYFEMKTNKELCFSILSFIILRYYSITFPQTFTAVLRGCVRKKYK